MASTPQPSPVWVDLPPELLAQVIARLPFPDDRARFRAVCRPWHSAMREHVCPGVPWIIHADGTLRDYDYRFLHRRVSFPDNTRFIGVDGSRLALYRTDANCGRRSYLLHDPFTKATMPLPGLDSVIEKVSGRFKNWKVLMQSDQDHLVAVTTNNSNYAIILCRPGKSGAWLPKRGKRPYPSIFDVAFHNGDLYGVTEQNGLVVLGLDEDDDGIPTVTSVEYVIAGDEVDGEDDEEAWSDDDDDDDDDDEEEEE